MRGCPAVSPSTLARIARRSVSLLLLGSWVAGGCSGEETPYSQVEDWECFELKQPDAAGAGGGAGAPAGGAGGEALGAGGAAEVTASCDCFGVKAGEDVDDARPKVNSCSGWRCCYAWPTSDGGYDCSCRDEPAGVQLAGYCLDLASERGGDVVDNCPPTPRDDGSYCAFQGESCDDEYLEEQSLSGCCAGFSCEADTHGTLVCR